MEVNTVSSDPNFMEYALKRSLISRNKLAIILKSDNKLLYCCVECPARYDEKEKLEQHLCVHNKEYRFLCGICGTGLKRKEHLERHTMEHNQVRPHVCTVCGKGFKRKEHLNIHQSIHYGDKSQVCSLCNRCFNRKDHLQKHLQTHSKWFLENNMCNMMSEEFLNIKSEFPDQEDQDMSGEMDCEPEPPEYLDINDLNGGGDSQGSASDGQVDIRSPPITDRPFVCEVCFKSYKRKDHLKIHSWTHMKKDKICTECGKGFHKEEQLFAHKRICILVHIKQSNEKPEPMDDSSEFSSENSLLVERRAIPAVEPEPEVDEEEAAKRPHECVVCRRRFKRKQHLKVHANVHLKNPTIWCSLCHEGFIRNDQFEDHVCASQAALIERVEEDAPDIPDMPDVQDIPLEAKKENSNPTQFLEQNMVEGETALAGAAPVDEESLPVPQKVFVCKYCSKAFRRKDHYKIHLNIHTGVKSFFCTDCGKGFYRKDHMQKHMQVHARPKQPPGKAKKQLPDLLPIGTVPKKEVIPEITIHAPSNSKLRVPLQMKVPYQMVEWSEDGRRRTLTVDPHSG